MANHEPPPLQRKRVPPQIGRLSIYFSKESVGTPTDSGEKTPPFRPISLFFTKFHYFSLFWVLSLGLQRTARIVLKPQKTQKTRKGRLRRKTASVFSASAATGDELVESRSVATVKAANPIPNAAASSRFDKKRRGLWAATTATRQEC